MSDLSSYAASSEEDRLLLYLSGYCRQLHGSNVNQDKLLVEEAHFKYYLCTLSICGCLFLSTVMVTWLDSTFGGVPLPLYSNSEIGCKMLTFMAHSCDFICVWMISWCLVTVLLYSSVQVFGEDSTLYGWCLVFAGLEPLPDGTSYCGYNLRQLHIFFSLLDTILCTVVPSLLIMVVNSLSIYRYRQCMKIYSSGVLRVRFLRVPDTGDNKMMEETTTAKKFLLSQQSQTTNNQLSTATSSSRSLLIVTSTFVLLNVPNYAFRLYEAVFIVEQTHFVQFMFFTTYLLYYLHHAVLFYMYIF
uniref:G-protein coupled receptors family 1 profile domain-containing protein n=1 Tax=Ditylenchus dipsaci TaxID=166011 RepID=A0A915ERY2_9BILA